MAATAPLGDSLAQAVGFAGIVSHDGVRYRRDGDRLLWAAPLGARAALPWLFGRRVAREVGRLYPSLKGVGVTHVWTAPARHAAHRMPQVGEIAPGLWVAGAFGDHAANTATMAGDLIARAIVEGDDRWRLFSPYDLVWTGGVLGKAAVSLVLPARRARDWAAGALARSSLAARFAVPPAEPPEDTPAVAVAVAEAVAEAPAPAKRASRKPARPKEAAQPAVEAAPRPKRRAVPCAPKEVLRPKRPVSAKPPVAGKPNGRDRRPAPDDAPAE
jgi:hypothetical protein